MEKLTKCLELAAEILNQYEGYEDYGDMMEGTKKIYGLIEDSIPYAKPLAKKFAEEHKDEKIIYIMSSGPTQQIAYSFFCQVSTCFIVCAEVSFVNGFSG